MTMQSPSIAAQRFGHPHIRTARDIEYDAFSRVTRGLQRAIRGDGSLVQAAAANAELWTTLAADLADEGNALPAAMRGSLLSLAIFSIRTSQRVMTGGAKADALVDINLSIMRGLRGEVAA